MALPFRGLVLALATGGATVVPLNIEDTSVVLFVPPSTTTKEGEPPSGVTAVNLAREEKDVPVAVPRSLIISLVAMRNVETAEEFEPPVCSNPVNATLTFCTTFVVNVTTFVSFVDCALSLAAPNVTIAPIVVSSIIFFIF
jgi:hypothetical protein